MTKTATPIRSLITGALLSGLALSACERGTPATKPLRQATISLEALTPDGTPGPSLEARSGVYNAVLTSLKPVADKGRNGETGAAYLLMAQAHAGLAERPAAQAAEHERMALDEIQTVRNALSQWLTSSALADAAASYDPTKELADIDAQIKEKQELRLSEQQKKGIVDKAVADILQQAKGKSDQAKAKRQQSGQLKAGMAHQTATQAEASLKQAQEVGRQADALEVEAATLEAQAAQRSPESAEVQLQIDKLSSQKDLLDAARAAVVKRAETAKGQAAECRKQATDAAKALSDRVKALEEHRDGELAKAFDDALSGFNAALQAAKKASQEVKGASQMTSGAIQQSIGDLQWGRARGFNAYADLMDALADSKPALPEATQCKTKAGEARGKAKELLDQATESYTAANDAYKAGGGSQVRERLLSVNESLAKVVEKTSGGAKDIRDPDAPKPETPPAGAEKPAGTSAAVEPGTPQATLQALFNVEKTGAYDTLPDLFATSNDAEKQALRSVFAIAPKAKRLEDAFKAKFGKGMKEMASEAGGAQGMGSTGGPDFDALSNIDASSLPVTVQGDTASAALPGGKTLKLVKKDGTWLVDMGSMGLQAQQLQMAQMMIGPMGKAMEELAAEVEAGKYADGKAAMQALQQKMMGAMGMPTGPGKK